MYALKKKLFNLVYEFEVIFQSSLVENKILLFIGSFKQEFF